MKKSPLIERPAPVVVLVRPQMAENVGMVARAMMNCGLWELRLVCPREDHLSRAAKRASSGADRILEQAKVFDDLDAAIADMHKVFATTARPRDMVKIVMTPEISADETDGLLAGKKRVAWLFGPERTGLENTDLAAADALVQIPLNPAHSSLNLSQAVLIMGYVWWMRGQTEKRVLMTGDGALSPKAEVTRWLQKLDADLDAAGYYGMPEKRDRMMRNLHNIFVRADLTSSEIKTLYNILTALTARKK